MIPDMFSDTYILFIAHWNFIFINIVFFYNGYQNQLNNKKWRTWIPIEVTVYT